MSQEILIGGEPLSFWMTEMSWWPKDVGVVIHGGQAGHDREIVISFGGYYSWENPVNDLVLEAIVKSLPDSWKVESRGTRIEIHPSGHFAGGFSEADVATVVRALPPVGFRIDQAEFRLAPGD